MKHYIEITLIENSDINLFSLWSKVFQQIHLGLVEMQDNQGRVPIGVSFPEYVTGGHSRFPSSHDTHTSLCIEKYSVLGAKCRLFAVDEATLGQFEVTKWLARLSDYVHCTSIRPVPEKVLGYAIYQREQSKTNPERLARRYAKRLAKRFPNGDNLDYASVLNSEVELSFKAAPDAPYEKKLLRYCDMPEKKITTPFIRLRSLSSEQTFCLWIKKTMVPELAGSGFSSYGLSTKTTVPEF